MFLQWVTYKLQPIIVKLHIDERKIELKDIFAGIFKRVVIGTLLFASLAGFTQTSFAASEHSIAVKVNGYEVVIAEGKAYIDGATDTTYVPLRFVSEALNAKVGWDAKTETASVAMDNPKSDVSVTVGKKTIKVNGLTKTLNAPAVLKVTPGYKYPRTMVPLRAISEGLGAKVNYNVAERTVEITTTWDTGVPEKPDTKPPVVTPPVVVPGGITGGTEGNMNWKPGNIPQKDVAPKIFNGIKYDKATKTLKVKLPEIKGKNLIGAIVEGPNPRKGKVTDLEWGKEYTISNLEDFSINIYIEGEYLGEAGIYDSYNIYSENVAKVATPKPIVGDITVIDQFGKVIPITVIYNALGIKQ
ncbi:copper amine oxidase N-terminal domain-containing protein [Paenibacillus sp. CMAA1364]